MRRSRSASELLFDPEIERTCRRNNATRRAQLATRNTVVVVENQGAEMGDENNNRRVLRDYNTPNLDGYASGIVRPPVQANNFELKTSLIQFVQSNCQFSGLPSEDPNAHISNFLEICDTIKINGASDDAIRLRLFPFSLRDKAKAWMKNLPQGTLATWEQVATKFLEKYFPPGKSAKLRNDITSFSQNEGETFYEAWERYKDLLARCPHHGIPDWMQIQTFYNGLGFNTKVMLDAAAGGSLNNKTPTESQELFELIASNDYQKPSDRVQKAKSVFEVDTTATLMAKMEALSVQNAAIQKQLGMINASSSSAAVLRCDFCQGNHLNGECSADPPLEEQVNYMGQAPRNNPYSNTYNSGWGNHPNFSWSNQGPQKQQYNPPPQQEKKASLEDMFQQFMTVHTTHVEKTEAQFKHYDALFKNQEASIRNIENQVGQISQLLSQRPPGSLPSNTVEYPREDVMAITLRNGRELGEPESKDEEVEKEAKDKRKKKYEISMRREVGDDEDVKTSTYVAPPPYDPPIPYPQRVKQQKKEQQDKQFAKFLQIFKKLEINIPFVEALTQMPSYVKFMKEILSQKRKIKDDETIMLTEECSAILQNKLPPKLKDPGSFTIPCVIGDLYFNKALCDLGAGVNLMPLSVFKKLGIGEVRPTLMSLQLADRSIKHPFGILDNVLVKVDKFIFPVDFVVLDMEEDKQVPLILGRPFLATSRALIDVEKGQLELRVQEEKITFNVFEAIAPPCDTQVCFRVEVVKPKMSCSIPITKVGEKEKKRKNKKRKVKNKEWKPHLDPLEHNHWNYKPNSTTLLFGKKMEGLAAIWSLKKPP